VVAVSRLFVAFAYILEHLVREIHEGGLASSKAVLDDDQLPLSGFVGLEGVFALFSGSLYISDLFGEEVFHSGEDDRTEGCLPKITGTLVFRAHAQEFGYLSRRCLVT
jgi:hypothetical protein